MDGFQDDDGCPDNDNDKDGISDKNDKCPNEAETKNGKEDEDGCPDLVRVEDGQIKILQKVYFATGKATILEKSNELLNEVAAVIKAKPTIKVKIEGYTDNVGRKAKNLKLSQRRADAVKEYLIKAGVKEDILTAEGRGSANPIADNKTKAGRAENRRVEFHIIPQKTETDKQVKPEKKLQQKTADHAQTKKTEATKALSADASKANSPEKPQKTSTSNK
jgi:outer membrane protein OmpA-like peptidoglycan-associated protein